MRALLGVLALAWCCAAAAQLRAIPPDAKRGTLRHVQDMIVEIDGARVYLAKGAQIRGQSNTIVLPAAVPPGSAVSKSGEVKQVWILTPQEAAAP
jgi:hypothetical protein